MLLVREDLLPPYKTRLSQELSLGLRDFQKWSIEVNSRCLVMTEIRVAYRGSGASGVNRTREQTALHLCNSSCPRPRALDQGLVASNFQHGSHHGPCYALASVSPFDHLYLLLLPRVALRRAESRSVGDIIIEEERPNRVLLEMFWPT